ncbi:ABC transporter ATP-binding protein [Microbacterium limosum]|uniref:ABC-type quaternary amine transporter n=1 Tax=Microbacterium limosum TaxID=3079935 RepID=A0AAU0MGY5_9MICO|nr:ABC transporter ATP-binding protein [Microbacterium sp. Y20]WOQ69415.1 ABC transporter ATP-binding protein [Microbacterium sp. Y20]
MTRRPIAQPHGVAALSADYGGGVEVLRDIDLGIEDGELVTVLGPSGSGKSTLLRTIAGLHPARSGTVHLGGRDVTTVRPERRRVGLVPQDGALFPRMSVAGNIAYGLRGVPAHRAAGHPRVRQLLELTDLTPLAGRFPHELSGGQQQRVALARALAPAPRLMLLDEPFSALDASLRARLRIEVVDLLRAQGVSTLLITHDQEEALSVSDRVGVLRDGRMEQLDSPDRLYARPENAWVAGFVGDAVLLPATRDGSGGLATVLGPLVGSQGTAPGSGSLGLYRPEQLALKPTERMTTMPGRTPVGTIERISRFGSHAVIAVRLDRAGSRVTIRRTGLHDLGVGDRVVVWAATPGVVVRA